MKIYSPREFAQLVGRTTQTLRRWEREGILRAYRTPTNRRYYTQQQYQELMGIPPSGRTVIAYCRVSNATQVQELKNQKAALEQFCIASGRVVSEWLEEVGSGLNFKRKQFVQLMKRVEKGEVGEIIVAHKDRLVRFGFDWFEQFCEGHGTALTVINAESLSPDEEMAQDLLAIVHNFSSRLNGLRKHEKTIKQIVKAEEKE
jgi:predicted site-specific integrase-resolvase